MAADRRTDLGSLQAKRTGDDMDAGGTAPSKRARLTSNTDASEPSSNKAGVATTSSPDGEAAALDGQQEQEQQQQEQQQALLASLLPALSGTNPNLAAVSCAAIAEMARDTAAADALLQEPTVMQGLLRCIEQTRSQEAAANAIAVLASNASTSVLEQDAVIKALMEQCCCSSDASALEHILHSLSKLSTTQPGAKLLLQHTPLLPAIVRHLGSSSFKVAELAAIILGELPMHADDGVQAVAQLQGIAQALARCLGSSDEGVALTAAQVLACLAALSPPPQSMLSDDVIMALVACLKHSSVRVAERVADAIACLAVNDTANSIIVEQGNLSDGLLTCLKSGDCELAGQAAWAVSQVALTTAGSQLFLSRTDITETLLCLMSREHAGACEAAMRALRHLACDMTEDDTFWQQPRTWQVLKDALAHRHAGVVEDAAKIVGFWAHVTTYDDDFDLGLQFGTIGPLLHCLNHANTNVVVTAAKSLSLMAETDIGCEAILQQAGVVIMVLACTKSGDPRIAEAASTLLAYIADSGLVGVNAIEEEPGAIRGLVHCLRFKAAAKAAARALRNITEDSDASFGTLIEAVTELCTEVQAAREKGSLEDITRNLQQAIVGTAQHLRS